MKVCVRFGDAAVFSRNMEYDKPSKRRRMTRSTTQDTTAVIIKEKNQIIPKPEELNAESLNPQCWSMLISYLPLADLVTLAQTHSSFTRIVDQFISSGNEITIDDVFVGRFPIQRNQHQYRRLGEMTRSLIITGITQVQANFLLPFFKDLTKLTLDKMEIAEGETSAFPTGIQSLKIAHSSIDKAFFCAWLTKTSLESVNLNKLQLTPLLQPNRNNWEYLESLIIGLKTVRHLTMERIDMNWGGFLVGLKELESLTMIHQIDYPYLPQLYMPHDPVKLRFLKVVADRCAPYRLPPRKLPALEHLSVRGKEPDLVWKSLQSRNFTLDLKTFECYDAPISYRGIGKWKGLEHVKIHCNWYQAANLRKTLSRTKSCIVTCCAPTPGCNFVDVLNDDCMQLILGYLEEEDIYKLVIVHPRFLNLKPLFKIDQGCLKLYPLATNGSFYDTLAMYTRELEVGKLNQSDLFMVLSHFTRLSRLIIHEQRLDDLNGVASFPIVKELHLHLSSSLTHAFWGALFRHLNPELKSLVLDGKVRELWYLEELTNIERLVINISKTKGSLQFLTQFFSQNQNLSHLVIQSESNYGIPQLLGTVLNNIHAPALRTFAYHKRNRYNYNDNSVALIPQLIIAFKNLDWLRIDLWAQSSQAIGNFAVLQHLTRLSIDGEYYMMDYDRDKILLFLNKVPNLEVLEVKAIREGDISDFSEQLKGFAEARGKPFSYRMRGKIHTFMFADDAAEELEEWN